MITGRVIISIASLASRSIVIIFPSLLLLLSMTFVFSSANLSIDKHTTLTSLSHQAWAFGPTATDNQTVSPLLSQAPTSINTSTTKSSTNEAANQTSSSNTSIPRREMGGGNLSLSEDEVSMPTGNHPPEAHDMIIQRNDLSAVAMDLNATDADTADRLTFMITLAPQSGNITQFDSSNGFMVYTPLSPASNHSINWVGSDFFRYMVTDNSGMSSDNATVSVQYCPTVADC
jgi:Big-like domain-containing protein